MDRCDEALERPPVQQLDYSRHIFHASGGLEPGEEVFKCHGLFSEGLGLVHHNTTDNILHSSLAMA